MESGERQRSVGAYRAGGAERRRPAWLRRLLGLLVLAGLIVLLIALLSGGDSGKKNAGGGAKSGALNAAGRSLSPSSLRDAVGTTAKGDAIVVQSVVPHEGFWVGSSSTQRVYVEFGGRVGTTERGYRPKTGDRVNLTGPVKPAPADPARALKLSPADGQLVRTEGAFINASRVARAP